MKKIIVIGCPGAGKSTFAKALAAKIDLPLYHLDRIWHKPDKTTISREAFDQKLNELMREEAWIIDGNYNRTIPLRLKECDTVFLLDYPLSSCLAGVRDRIGKPREDMPWIETALDENFRAWIEAFPETQLPKIYAMLAAHPDKTIYIFHTREEADFFLKNL